MKNDAFGSQDPKEAMERFLNDVSLLESEAFEELLSYRRICDELAAVFTEDETCRGVISGVFSYRLGENTRTGFRINGCSKSGRCSIITILLLEPGDQDFLEKFPGMFAIHFDPYGLRKETLRTWTQTVPFDAYPWDPQFQGRKTVRYLICLSREDIFGRGKGRYLSDVPFAENDLPEGTMPVPTLFANLRYADQSRLGKLIRLLDRPFEASRRGCFPELEAYMDDWHDRMKSAVADRQMDNREKLAQILAAAEMMSGEEYFPTWREEGGKEFERLVNELSAKHRKRLDRQEYWERNRCEKRRINL